MTEAERAQIAGRPLLLYDGVCVLCNGVVHFVLRHDKHSIFRFAPLQSRLAHEILPQPPSQEGVILITGTLAPSQHIFHRSDAVAEALHLLGASWKSFGTVLRLIPRPLRELGYTLIARLRYRLFGRYAACPIPSPDQRSKILGISE